MPYFPRNSPTDAPVLTDASLAALLAGAAVPAGSEPELQALAGALAELTGRAAGDELRGEAETLAAFRSQAGGWNADRQPPARTPPLFFRPLPVKAAAAAAAAVLGLGGIAAAYAGALPAGLQRFAHDVIGAPSPGTPPTARPSWASPAATDGPAYGLCTAWAHAKADGTPKQQAAAFGKLAAAAGGPGRVTAYCATAAHPRTSASPRPHPSPTPHGSGKPMAHPSPHGSGKPSGLPAPHGSGKPTAVPTPHGSGKPTALPTPHGSGKPTAPPTPHSSAEPTAHPTGKPSGHS